ncbi:MAG: hypothetical protein AAGA60_09475 [Cyanobacteria bacterium P01_E01_bin.42]
MSWRIQPDKQGNLGYDDWHLGFRDYNSGKIEHPQNNHYASGWLHAWGMDDAYNAVSPKLPDNPDYFDGYDTAAYERWCHLNCCWKQFPCTRFIKTTQCECTEEK